MEEATISVNVLVEDVIETDPVLNKRCWLKIWECREYLVVLVVFIGNSCNCRTLNFLFVFFLNDEKIKYFEISSC